MRGGDARYRHRRRDHGGVAWVVIGPGQIAFTVWSTDPDPDVGDDDTIVTGDGDDLVFGGTGNDTINVGNGHNLVLGDSGRYYLRTELTPSWSLLPVTIGRLETTDPAIGGNDRITSGNGIDWIAGGAGNDLIRSGAGDGARAPRRAQLPAAAFSIAGRIVSAFSPVAGACCRPLS